MKEVKKLDHPIPWMLDCKEILIDKIETCTHVWEPIIPFEERVTTIEPRKTLLNVISNVGQLPTGSFSYQEDEQTITTKLLENNKRTLIVTKWIFPVQAFDLAIRELQAKGLNGDLFIMENSNYGKV